MEEMQQHQGEWFFLHELNVVKVCSTSQRADYLILYYIKVEQETRPGEKLYLSDLAAAMGVRVTELSKGIEKLQDQGYVRWLTDREAGRTYVELTSKAVELMAEERDLMKRCYARLRTELGDEELRRTVDHAFGVHQPGQGDQGMIHQQMRLPPFRQQGGDEPSRLDEVAIPGQLQDKEGWKGRQ